MRGCGESEGERGRVICLEQVEDTRSALHLSRRRGPRWTRSASACSATASARRSRSTRRAWTRASPPASPPAAGATARRSSASSTHRPKPGSASPHDGARPAPQAKRGESMMVSRYDIVPIPPGLRGNLAPGSIMEFPFEVVESMYAFTANDVVGKIAPRPLLLLHPRQRHGDADRAVDRSLRARRPAGRPAPLRRRRSLHVQRRATRWCQTWCATGWRAISRHDRKAKRRARPRLRSPSGSTRWVSRDLPCRRVERRARANRGEVLVWANLRGMDSHGVLRVPRYVELIRNGDLNPRPSMATRTKLRPACCSTRTARRGRWR